MGGSFLIYIALSGLAAYFLEKVVYSGKKLRIPRIGTDPGLFGLAAARADFLANGYHHIAKGYAKASSLI